MEDSQDFISVMIRSGLRFRRITWGRNIMPQINRNLSFGWWYHSQSTLTMGGTSGDKKSKAIWVSMAKDEWARERRRVHCPPWRIFQWRAFQKTRNWPPIRWSFSHFLLCRWSFERQFFGFFKRSPLKNPPPVSKKSLGILGHSKTRKLRSQLNALALSLDVYMC